MIIEKQEADTVKQYFDNNNTYKNRWLKLVICIFILAIVIVTNVFIGYKFIKYEKQQNKRIQLLEEQIKKTNARIKDMTLNDIEWLDNGFNYLAIGNSITIHNLSSYWWNEIGMAASDKDHDYFHIVSSYLQSKNHKFMGYAYNFSVWEVQSHDRDETLMLLDHYLSPKLNLITIQLAENASDLTTIEQDYKSLIKYIKEKAPNAKILLIGDFWTKKNRNDLKIKAAEATNIKFVSLDGIADNSDYYCGKGTVVFDNNGGKHVVDHAGVAKHPGDKGMQAIANRIINSL